MTHAISNRRKAKQYGNPFHTSCTLVGVSEAAFWHFLQLSWPFFLPMNIILDVALVYSKKPRIFQMFGEVMFSDIPNIPGSFPQILSPSQISLWCLMGVGTFTYCLLSLYVVFRWPLLKSPSFRIRKAFSYFSFPILPLSHGGRKVWVNLNDKWNGGIVVENRRLNRGIMQRQQSNITLIRKAQSKRWYHLLAQVFQIPEMLNHMYVANTTAALENLTE